MKILHDLDNPQKKLSFDYMDFIDLTRSTFDLEFNK